MIYVSLVELLSTAREYDGGHISMYGVVVGMAVMTLSLLMFL
jgi:ZIP family zinc transporter